MEKIWILMSTYLKEGEVGQHVGYPLSIVSLIKEVQLQWHVLLGLLHQPHKGKVWEEPMNGLHQYLGRRYGQQLIHK